MLKLVHSLAVAILFFLITHFMVCPVIFAFRNNIMKVYVISFFSFCTRDFLSVFVWIAKVLFVLISSFWLVFISVLQPNGCLGFKALSEKYEPV